MPTKKDSKSIVKDILSANKLPAQLLIICPDITRTERLIANILKKFTPDYDEKSGRANSVSYLRAEDLTTVNFHNFVDRYNSQSLFSKENFFIIKDAHELSSSLNKHLLNLLEDKNPDAHIILAAEKLASNSVILNYFKKKNILVEIEELKGQELNRWVERELKSAGVKEWDDIVIEAIIQSSESSPAKISDLINKFSLYLDGSRATLGDLNQISKFSPNASEFQLLDYLGNKNLTYKSEILLNKIFESGKSPFALLGLFARSYINYLQIASLRESGFNMQQIRQKLGLAPWIFNKQYEASQKFTSTRLKKGLKSILLADSKLKNRSLGDEVIFSELINCL